MAFTSLNFLIFIMAAVLVYYLCPLKFRWVALLAASYAFYLLSSPKTFIYVLITTVITFFGGKAIGTHNANHKAYMALHKKEMTKEEKKAAKAATQKKKKVAVAITLICDFGILATLKYFRYYLTALGVGIFDAGLLLPLGISFYTFQSAAYIMDLYRNKIEPDTNIGKFGLYTAFFPQMMQGPISRHDQLAHQLYDGNKFKYENLAHGAQLILWGFFKKLIIADRVAILVNEVFDNYSDYTGGVIFVALIFYTIQIYADFSGGIDIARGVAQCMGIDMTHNFMRPYFADSLSEFWRRWHMSLSFWCRDYIFYPIAMSKFFGQMGKKLRSVFGDRVGKLFPVIIAQFATFLTIGLWHGAEFKYIAYGLYNGIVIVLGLLLEPYFVSWKEKLHIKDSNPVWKLFCILRTFFIVVFGRIFPKAASFPVAISMFFSMFRFNHGTSFIHSVGSLGLNMNDFYVLVLAIAIWFLISLYEEHVYRRDGGTGTEALRNMIDSKPLPLRWFLYLAALALVWVVGIYGLGYDPAAFIYRGF